VTKKTKRVHTIHYNRPSNLMSLLYNTNGYLQNSDIPYLKENVYWKTLTYLAARRMGIFKTDIPCFKENGYWKTLTSLASWQMGIAKL
jgi:hypothetical protein